MKTSSQNPVNAGSMADIAFLLLIFFLVSTTIETDMGINQKLPPECKGDCSRNLAENNMLRISLGKNNELMVKEKLVPMSELKGIVKQFIDNNKDGNCNYCNGLGSPNESDSPQKAVISLRTDREASYKSFIAVQNKLMESYNELRKEYAVKKYDRDLSDLTKAELESVKKAYPQIISEAEIN